jgi:DNA/RNA endonuclease G (NUC1)
MKITIRACSLASNVIILALLSPSLFAADYKPIVLDSSYQHTKYSPICAGFEKKFRAYTSCFDNKADDGEAWRIPDFVSYQMKALEGTLPAGPDRPSPWITEGSLRASDEIATDASYTYSRAFRRDNPNWFVRGHLVMKQHAWRLGEAADWNTHTMLNAVPQRQDFNAGIWLDLEYKSADLADAFRKRICHWIAI